MILVIILHEELQREIGMNLVKENMFASFGIRARREELELPPILKYF